MRVAVVGLGKLGVPMAAVLSSKGHDVMGVDVNDEVVAAVNNGIAPVWEPALQQLIDRFPFTATHAYGNLNPLPEVTIVIVPTPSESSGAFSNRYVIEALREIGVALADSPEFHTVVVCSTVMPGSCQGELRKALSQAGAPDVPICYSPEFIALGSVVDDLQNPDMVLIGSSDPVASKVVENLLRTVVVNDPVFCHMTPVDAEIAKIAVNAFVTMKISFANTLSEICDRQRGASAAVVTEAIGYDGRIGSNYLSPGTAFGGPCFPRDSDAFAVVAGDGADLAEATQVVNDRQTQRLVRLIDDFAPQTVGILGVSYKPNTPVIECSPSADLAAMLSDRGYVVRLFDFVVEPSGGFEWCDTIDECANADVVVVMHPDRRFATLPRARTIIDCWGICDRAPNVVVLGES